MTSIDERQLTPRQRSRLRALAHPLEPTVRIGQKGLSPSVISETDRSLESHELIKIRIDLDDREHRRKLARDLALECRADLVSTVGKTAVLYRPRRENPKIRLAGAEQKGIR